MQYNGKVVRRQIPLGLNQDLHSVRCSTVLGRWQLQLLAAFPVTRLTTAMHNRQNQNVVLLNCVENTIGKLTRHTTPNIFINCSVASWGFPDSVDCIFNSIYKRLSNLSPLLRVVLNCFSVFIQRLG